MPANRGPLALLALLAAVVAVGLLLYSPATLPLLVVLGIIALPVLVLALLAANRRRPA